MFMYTSTRTPHIYNIIYKHVCVCLFEIFCFRAVQGKMPSPSVGMTSAAVAIGASKQEQNVPESERAQAK